jgi:hypothetical protein
MGEQTGFLPFHAINEFMRPDFRLSIIRDVLNNLPNLTKERTSAIARLTNRDVKIPGFRNSEKAPTIVKSLPFSKAFEKSPDLVGEIIAAWTEIHSDLRTQVYTVMNSRHWPIFESVQEFSIGSITSEFIKAWPVLPPEIDRTRLPGFIPRWPKNEDFNTLYHDFIEQYPESDASIDKVSLMVVWLALRLPIEMEEENNTLVVDEHIEGSGAANE